MSEFSKVLLFIIWSLAMMLIGGALQFESNRKAAVKAGKAEYYLDENNQRQWRWK